MSQRIPYDQAFNLSKLAAQAVHQVLEARDAMVRVQRVLDMAQYGAPADWAAVADELGLIDQPGKTRLQQAADFYSIFQTATLRLDHDAVRIELARLDQG